MVFTQSLRAAAGFAGLALALSACGGGGGASAVPGAPRTGGPGSTTSAATSQQAAVNSAAQEVRAEKWAAQYAQPMHAFRRILHEHARHVLGIAALSSPAPSASPSASPSPAPSPAACSGASSDSVAQNPNGSITIHHLGYYDDACSILADDALTTISAADASGKMTGTGTEISYNADGKTVSEYDVLDLVIYNANPGTGDLAMRIKRFPSAAAAGSGAAPLDTDWFASVDTAPNTEKIGAASIAQDPSFPTRQFGSNATYVATVTGGLFGTNQTTTVTGSTVNVQDPAGRLAIASYPLAAGAWQWTINGGTPLGTTTTAETSTEDSTGLLLSYSNTTTDSAGDLTVTITGNTGGTSFTGVIKQTSTGIVLAKFVVDADGNGTITFADGTTKPVQNWCWGG